MFLGSSGQGLQAGRVVFHQFQGATPEVFLPDVHPQGLLRHFLAGGAAGQFQQFLIAGEEGLPLLPQLLRQAQAEEKAEGVGR